MLRILWLAPNFNHYKARFLNHLADEPDVHLTILSGTGRKGMGDQELDGDWKFHSIKVHASKKNFGKSKLVRKELKLIFKHFDWVLIPAEKKNLPLLLYAMRLRKEHGSTHLFSYNHAQLKSNHTSIYSFLDTRLTKFFNENLDRVIFYTEAAREKAIENKLINSKKAFWANNTVDNIEIEKYYEYHFPPLDNPTILFIGRLIPSKRISDLFKYYKLLKKVHQDLKLEIIGDGPECEIVEMATEGDSDIVWHRTLVDEDKIAAIMKRVSLVFIPGLSGLSINHAFAYGKPYITFNSENHGPEISYLIEGENGFILEDNLEENLNKISELLNNRNLLSNFSKKAKEKSEFLSVNNWVQQIKSSLLNE